MYVYLYIHMFFVFVRHPLGTHVPGTTTLNPLLNKGAKYPSPRAQKRALREMSRHPKAEPKKGKEEVRSEVVPQAAFQGPDEQ